MAIATNGVGNGVDEQSKAPFLRRVRIRGYKSIAFCDVSLTPLTILVGRNAAGKSNFVDALGFLSDLMDVRATKAVNERNGWKAIQCRTSHSPTIEFEVSSAFDSYQSSWEAEYSFSSNSLNKIRFASLARNSC